MLCEIGKQVRFRCERFSKIPRLFFGFNVHWEWNVKSCCRLSYSGFLRKTCQSICQSRMLGSSGIAYTKMWWTACPRSYHTRFSTHSNNMMLLLWTDCVCTWVIEREARLRFLVFISLWYQEHWLAQCNADMRGWIKNLMGSRVMKCLNMMSRLNWPLSVTLGS